jgi:HTH-like domain
MSFALIQARKAETLITLPVEMACAVLNVSVSGYYAWKRREASPRQRRDMVLLAHIRAQFTTSHETYGSPRMHVELKEDGLCAGKHRVARLMRDNGLKARQKPGSRKPQTAIMPDLLPPICSTRTSRLTNRTRNGASTSPTSGPPKAGCIWPLCSISSHAASSAGPSATA